VGVVAAVGGVAGNLGSIIDLFERFFGPEENTREATLPSVPIAGAWQAEVRYDWGAKHTERFNFRVEGSEVGGTATYLGRARGILEGKMAGEKLTFVLKTQEVLGDSPSRAVLHQYRGIATPDRIRFVLQTTGGYTEHLPVEFTAQRVP
jgi:hypothetical protein